MSEYPTTDNFSPMQVFKFSTDHMWHTTMARKNE